MIGPVLLWALICTLVILSACVFPTKSQREREEMQRKKQKGVALRNQVEQNCKANPNRYVQVARPSRAAASTLLSELKAKGLEGYTKTEGDTTYVMAIYNQGDNQ